MIAVLNSDLIELSFKRFILQVCSVEQFLLCTITFKLSDLISLSKNLTVIFIELSESFSEYQSVIINPPE